MASGEIGEIMTFVEGLMSTESGLNNRAQYGFVELVAWLHEQSLAPFTINTSVPRPNQRWTSALFGPFGELSSLGQRFFEYCPPAPPMPELPEGSLATDHALIADADARDDRRERRARHDARRRVGREQSLLEIATLPTVLVRSSSLGLQSAAPIAWARLLAHQLRGHANVELLVDTTFCAGLWCDAADAGMPLPAPLPCATDR